MLSQKMYEKINKAFNENYLIGNVLFSDEEKSQLYDYVGDFFRRRITIRNDCIYVAECKLLMMALVELTKEWSRDEDSWLDFISKKLLGQSVQTAGKFHQQITLCMNYLRKNENLLMLNGITKKYYATACCHAFAPKASVFSLFDMCWEIYCSDFNQYYEENDPVLELIVERLKSRFTSNDRSGEDDITFGSNVYSLRIGLIGLITERPEMFRLLLNEGFASINSLMNSEPLKVDTYFKQLLLDR